MPTPLPTIPALPLRLCGNSIFAMTDISTPQASLPIVFCLTLQDESGMMAPDDQGRAAKLERKFGHLASIPDKSRLVMRLSNEEKREWYFYVDDGVRFEARLKGLIGGLNYPVKFHHESDPAWGAFFAIANFARQLPISPFTSELTALSAMLKARTACKVSQDLPPHLTHLARILWSRAYLEPPRLVLAKGKFPSGAMQELTSAFKAWQVLGFQQIADGESQAYREVNHGKRMPIRFARHPKTGAVLSI